MKEYSVPTIGYLSLELHEPIADEPCGVHNGAVGGLDSGCVEVPMTQTVPAVPCCGPYQLSV